jgi:hypothetical protein
MAYFEETPIWTDELTKLEVTDVIGGDYDYQKVEINKVVNRTSWMKLVLDNINKKMDEALNDPFAPELIGEKIVYLKSVKDELKSAINYLNLLGGSPQIADNTAFTEYANYIQNAATTTLDVSNIIIIKDISLINKTGGISWKDPRKAFDHIEIELVGTYVGYTNEVYYVGKGVQHFVPYFSPEYDPNELNTPLLTYKITVVYPNDVRSTGELTAPMVYQKYNDVKPLRVVMNADKARRIRVLFDNKFTLLKDSAHTGLVVGKYGPDNETWDSRHNYGNCGFVVKENGTRILNTIVYYRAAYQGIPYTDGALDADYDEDDTYIELIVEDSLVKGSVYTLDYLPTTGCIRKPYDGGLLTAFANFPIQNTSRANKAKLMLASFVNPSDNTSLTGAELRLLFDIPVTINGEGSVGLYNKFNISNGTAVSVNYLNHKFNPIRLNLSRSISDSDLTLKLDFPYISGIVDRRHYGRVEAVSNVQIYKRSEPSIVFPGDDIEYSHLQIVKSFISEDDPNHLQIVFNDTVYIDYMPDVYLELKTDINDIYVNKDQLYAIGLEISNIFDSSGNDRIQFKSLKVKDNVIFLEFLDSLEDHPLYANNEYAGEISLVNYSSFDYNVKISDVFDNKNLYQAHLVNIINNYTNNTSDPDAMNDEIQQLFTGIDGFDSCLLDFLGVYSNKEALDILKRWKDNVVDHGRIVNVIGSYLDLGGYYKYPTDYTIGNPNDNVGSWKELESGYYMRREDDDYVWRKTHPEPLEGDVIFERRYNEWEARYNAVANEYYRLNSYPVYGEPGHKNETEDEYYDRVAEFDQMYDYTMEEFESSYPQPVQGEAGHTEENKSYETWETEHNAWVLLYNAFLSNWDENNPPKDWEYESDPHDYECIPDGVNDGMSTYVTIADFNAYKRFPEASDNNFNHIILNFNRNITYGPMFHNIPNAIADRNYENSSSKIRLDKMVPVIQQLLDVTILPITRQEDVPNTTNWGYTKRSRYLWLPTQYEAFGVNWRLSVDYYKKPESAYLKLLLGLFGSYYQNGYSEDPYSFLLNYSLVILNKRLFSSFIYDKTNNNVKTFAMDWRNSRNFVLNPIPLDRYIGIPYQGRDNAAMFSESENLYYGEAPSFAI